MSREFWIDAQLLGMGLKTNVLTRKPRFQSKPYIHVVELRPGDRVIRANDQPTLIGGKANAIATQKRSG